jgi:hypothetical protein
VQVGVGVVGVVESQAQPAAQMATSASAMRRMFGALPVPKRIHCKRDTGERTVRNGL